MVLAPRAGVSGVSSVRVICADALAQPDYWRE